MEHKDFRILGLAASLRRASFHRGIVRAIAYSREHFEDPPEISNWTWTP